MIDPLKFGKKPGTEIKFFTPEEASKIPGVKSGYNAIQKIGDRVRYELLQAGKSMGGESVVVEQKVVAPEPVIVPEVVVEVKEEPISPVVEEEKVQEVVTEEVKEEQPAEVPEQTLITKNNKKR